MPITSTMKLVRIDQESFHEFDRMVTGHAFRIHNSMGRFCDEGIYRDELSYQCAKSGAPCAREVEIRAIHRSFSKSYFMDLVVGTGAVYELKAVESITPAHHNQLLHYLFLSGLNHGKLLNFRPASVQSWFVSTSLSPSDRNKAVFEGDPDALPTPRHRDLLSVVRNLIADWGTHLEIALYREAAIHLMEGTGATVEPIPMWSHGRLIGSQKMCLLNSEHGWHFSSILDQTASHEKHVRRLMAHTRLKSMLWFNFNRSEIRFRTIHNDSVPK